MKKIFTNPNFHAVILILLSIGETITLILCKPFSIGIVILIQVGSLLAIAYIRFAYKLALWSNKWYSMWNRKHTNPENDEPSDLAVGMIKAVGYIVLIGLFSLLFIFI